MRIVLRQNSVLNYGTKLQQACPQCGIVVGITAKFCSECGAFLAQAPSPPVGPSFEEQFTTFQATLPTSVREQLSTPTDGENRIVTILFTDMSGSVQATSHLHPEDAAVLGACSTWGRPLKQPRISPMRTLNQPSASHLGQNVTRLTSMIAASPN